MSGSRLPSSLRQELRQQAGYRCEYYQTPEWLVGMEHEIDHIVPRAAGGESVADNLCVACSSCNSYKHAKTHGFDQESGAETPLFNPRQRNWAEHFAWDEDGTRVIGITSTGRATIEALQINHPLIVITRSIWASFGYHPPRTIS